MRETKTNYIVSVVVPCFNEAEGIYAFLSVLNSTLLKMGKKYEIIVVDDGSLDETLSRVKTARLELKSPITILKLHRNFGHMKALEVGLRYATGKYVFSLDGDGQDPPHLIPQMFEMIEKNKEIEVVQAVRRDRSSDSLVKRFTAHLFYRIMKDLTGQKLVPHAADYRVMKNESLSRLLQAGGHKKVYRFLIPHLGFRTEYFYFDRPKRDFGKTKYNLSKMAALALDSVVAFSSYPLRLITKIGLISSLLFLFLSFLITILYLHGNTVPGWASIAMLLLSISSFIVCAVGVVGIYVAEIYDQVRPQPLDYLVI